MIHTTQFMDTVNNKKKKKKLKKLLLTEVT